MSVVETLAKLAFPIVGGGQAFDADAVDDLYRLCGR